MSYAKFLARLFEDGRTVVPDLSPLTEEEMSAGDAVFIEYERLDRLEMPGNAPELVPTACRWAGTRFFRACQFAVHRDVDKETVNLELSVSFGEAITPEVHYCVDLVFRYLPDLAKFASSAAENDPLVEHLNRWAREWPLSSVGMPDINEFVIDGFAGHASLMQRYVDRIIATGDQSRLADLRVQQAATSALGMFPNLAPTIAAALTEIDSQDTTP